MDIHGPILTKEVWRDISGYPDYQVSDFGNVRSIKSGTWKTLSTKSNTLSPKLYPTICLYSGSRDTAKNFLVHRLVAEAFKEPPSAHLIEECKKTVVGIPIINHKDGDRHNNNADNLEWCTYSHNNSEAYTMGREQTKGDGYHLSKLTEDKVQEIISLLDNGVPHRNVVKLFGVSRNTISSLNNGYSWSHVTGRSKKIQRRRAKTKPLCQ